nr:MAG: hypothetical protein E4H34_03545 [Hyphomicrobiales bacterium]
MRGARNFITQIAQPTAPFPTISARNKGSLADRCTRSRPRASYNKRSECVSKSREENMTISKILLCSYTALALTAAATTATAQRVPEEFTIGGEAAAALNDYISINSDTARRLSDTCFEIIERESGATSATVVILNPYGLVVDQRSTDGQRYTSIKITENKAHTALHYRRDTLGINQSLADDPWQLFRYHQIGLESAQAGGVPIIVNDQLIGAMGIGGYGGGPLYHTVAMMCLEAIFGPQE